MTELAKRIAAHPFKAVGLAFALGFGMGARGRRTRRGERGIAAAVFAGGIALGLRMLRNVAMDQILSSLKAELHRTDEAAGERARATHDPMVH